MHIVRILTRSWITGIGLALLAAGASAADWPACGQVERFPGPAWELSQPTDKAWDSVSLNQAQAYFEELDSNGLMVIHRGHLIASWGDVDEPRILASLRKSVASALMGVAVGRQQLKLDATLAQLGIDDSEPPLTPDQKQATVQDLIMSRSGIYHSAHYEIGSWKRAKQALSDYANSKTGSPGLPHGSVWLYNNWDFNTAAVILEQAMGEPMGSAFLRDIARPLDMQDFETDHVSYVGNDSYAERRMGNLSDHPAYMFELSVRDLARLGLLYLNCGKWQEQQIVPRQWVLESTTGRGIAEGAPEVLDLSGLGNYGYMWWVDRPGSRSWKEPKTRQPVYFGQGYRGHYLWIAPYLDLVVAHQVATQGGIGTIGQLRRRLFGSPAISDAEFQRLLQLIIAAHPQGDEAWATEPG